MQQTNSGLILPSYDPLIPPEPPEDLPNSETDEEFIAEAIERIENSPVVLKAKKKLAKAYEKYQEAVRYEADRLAAERDEA
jgi:hypothetical protein